MADPRPPSLPRKRARGGWLSRRSLLQKGALGGALPIWLRSTLTARAPKQPLRLFTPAEHAIFAAAAVRLVAGDADGSAGWPRVEDVDVAGKVDALIARLHPTAAAEFRQLLHVFENGMTGLFTIGSPTPFTRSDGAAQDRRLEAWRHSRVALFRSGYQALKRLAHAAYYASPETYAAVGYPGPPVVPQPPEGSTPPGGSTP